MKKLFVLLAASFCLSISAQTEQDRFIYKQIDTLGLYMQHFVPDNMQPDSAYPAIIFFHGGGWNGGTPTHFLPQAQYFASRGLVCFLVKYRLRKEHGATPFDALKDAKSAIRYLKAHAEELSIDPLRIVAAGGSAGGHLAAATSLVPGYNDSKDDLSVSTKAFALVLFNPVFDNGPGGYGYERIGDAYPSFSPLHNLRRGAPPTVLLFGDQDALVPVETIHYYTKMMEKIGSRCDLHLYPGQKHGFFNPHTKEYFQKTVIVVDQFLASLGLLEGTPTMKVE